MIERKRIEPQDVLRQERERDAGPSRLRGSGCVLSFDGADCNESES